MLRNYLLTAFRNFRKNKVFSFINIVGLTLGIGCSLALFMVVRYEWSYDGYHAGHQRTWRIVSDFRYPEGTEYQDGVPYPLPGAFKHEFPQAKVVSIYSAGNTVVSIGDGQIQGNAPTQRFREEQGVFYTEPSFFGIFDFKWLRGDPGILDQPNKVALSKTLAEKYFGDWKNAIGKTIQKDEKELLTVEGIFEDPPTNTDLPLQAAISYATMAQSVKDKDWGSVSGRFQCYVLLPTELSIQQVRSQLPAFHRKYVNNKTDFYSLQPLSDIHFNERYGNFTGKTVRKDTLWTLSMIAGFLLVLGCINFINLSTAQAIRRRKEVGIRKVLGSLRWQLIIQFLGETALLVLISVLLAITVLTFLAPHSAGLLNSAVSLKPLRSGETMLWTGGILVLVTLLSGFYPALLISGRHPMEALKNKLSTGRTNGLSLRRVLVVAQMVIAQALITGVIVAIAQVNFFRNAPMGFEQHAIVTVNLPGDSVSRTKWESFRHDLLQTSGVEKISLSSNPPAGRGNSFVTFRFDQQVKTENFELNLKLADADYFSTYGIPLLAGRSYLPSDTTREFVVNETFLKKKGIRSPAAVLGKFIYIDNVKGAVVGVVRDFHEHSLRDPIDPLAITTNKAGYRMAGLKLQTAGMPATIAALEKIFNGYFPKYFFEHRFLDDTIARYYEQEQRLSSLFTLFAAVALTISCLGLYGLILFTTTQRIKEVGIRKVLGASAGRISLLFVGEFCWLTGIAFCIAAPLAWYGMQQWLENFTYRIHISAWMFAVSGMAAFLTGLLTIGIRTIRTAMSNPVNSLRSE